MFNTTDVVNRFLAMNKTMLNRGMKSLEEFEKNRPEVKIYFLSYKKLISGRYYQLICLKNTFNLFCFSLSFGFNFFLYCSGKY